MLGFIELRTINSVSTVTGDFTQAATLVILLVPLLAPWLRTHLFVIPAQCIGTKIGDGRLISAIAECFDPPSVGFIQL